MRGRVVVDEPKHIPSRTMGVDVLDELHRLATMPTSSVHDDRMNAVAKEITHDKSPVKSITMLRVIDVSRSESQLLCPAAPPSLSGNQESRSCQLRAVPARRSTR
jgi:hypothetical protein